MTLTGKIWWVWRLRVFLDRLIYGGSRSGVVGLAFGDNILLVAIMDREDGLVYAQVACTLPQAREFQSTLDNVISRMEIASGSV